MRVAGVNVKAGHILIGVVGAGEGDVLAVPVEQGASRLTVNSGLEDAHALADLRDRVKQQLRASRVESVGLVGTRSYTGWKYKDAYARIGPVCAVMLASAELSVPYEELKTSVIGKTVSAPAADLKSVELSRFGLMKAPLYWTTGLAEAYCAAATILAKAARA